MTVRVKICGIARVEDALVAAAAGADAVGLVFAESPRKVTAHEASRIVSSLPPFVCPVGVFVDCSPEEIAKTVRAVGLHCVQLSGSEPPEYIARLRGFDVIKAIHIGKREDVEQAREYEGVTLLLDTASEGVAGGTGETFPWEYAAALSARRRVILAGGLTPENVAQAIAAVRPWAVDVSSGVEKSPGTKDAGKIRDFVTRARSVRYAESQR